MRTSIIRRLTAQLIPLALLLTVVFSGCDSNSVDATRVAAATVAPSEAQTALNPVQMRAIEALLESSEAAWTAKDASAYAAKYTIDADWVNPLGGTLSSREQIRNVHQFLFAGPFANSTQTATVRRAVSLSGTVALVDLDVTLTGYPQPLLLPGLVEFAPGEVRTRNKWVVVREGSEWLIMAQHMTAVQPPPPPPPPAP